MGVVRLRDVRLQDVRLGVVRLGVVHLGDVLLGDILLGVAAGGVFILGLALSPWIIILPGDTSVAKVAVVPITVGSTEFVESSLMHDPLLSSPSLEWRRFLADDGSMLPSNTTMTLSCEAGWSVLLVLAVLASCCLHDAIFGLFSYGPGTCCSTRR